MGLIKGALKATGMLIAGSAAVTGAVIVGTGALVVGTVEAMVDSNNEPGTTASINTKYNSKLNTYGNAAIETELSKLPKKVKKALVKNRITIEINDNAVRRLGPNTEGFYSYGDRRIVIKHNENSIKYALLHEIGHALDHIANISSKKAIRKSYGRYEVPFDNDYFYSSVEEYVAQSIAEYCNGTLPKNTTMYNKLDIILDSIAWESIDN